VNSPRLTAEIGFAVVGFEERPDRAVGIERDERAARAIESRRRSIRPAKLLDVASHRRIAERLRGAQILLLRYAAKLGAVLREMLIELGTRVEADARSSDRVARRRRLCRNRDIPASIAFDGAPIAPATRGDRARYSNQRKSEQCAKHVAM